MNPQQWRANQKAAWAAGWAAKFGPNWWQSSAARKQVAIAGNRQRGPNMRAGMSLGRGLGVRFDPQMAPEQLRAIKALPMKMQERFRRRAMRQALNVFKRLAQPLYKRHRTKLQRLHLADHLFIVSKTYRQRKSKGLRTLWGAMGFRAGPIGGRYVRSGKLPRFQGGAETQFPGWRAHFLERGFTATGGLLRRRNGRVLTKLENALAGYDQRKRIKDAVKGGQGRRMPGKRYMTAVWSAGQFAAASVFQHAIRELLRTQGARIGRIPKSLYASEMRALLA
jgi:hypothetical protein